MIITKIATKRFAKHKEVTVDLPRTGLVLVTGDNGEGKSTISEAVAQGVWNVAIRGLPGWRTGEKSGVRIDFDGGHVARAVSKSKHVLTWTCDEDGAGEYPTRTKSQEALESHVGSFHVWRHACVFHTKEAAMFSEATDAERKRLLEYVLELHRVEVAYRNAMKEVNVKKAGVREAEHLVAMAQARVSSVDSQLDLLRGELEDVPDIDAMREQGRHWRSQVEEQRSVVKGIEDEVVELNAEIRQLSYELEQARGRVAKFESLTGVCEACEQEIDHDHAEVEAAKAGTRKVAIELKLGGKQNRHKALAADIREERERLADLERRYQDNVDAGRQAVAAKKRNDERAGKLAGLEDDHAKASAELDDAKAALASAAKSLAEIEAAASVLSYTGVRASMLDAAVQALQEMANAWLERLGLSNISVELSSQSANKKGSVSDKISFDVKGAGGGLGYKAASTGEQRRIDIAMLLAIGELAGESRGMSAESTMFVDELFDGLDTEGVACVVTMLRELAQQRCVVVITHNQNLVNSLAPDLHLVAENGQITGK